MYRTASDLMRANPITVSPEASLAELDRLFVEHRIGALPVVESETLVGLVTRTDIVRKMCIEQSLAEITISPDGEVVSALDSMQSSLDTIGAQVGHRMANLKVKHVMSQPVRSVAADRPLNEVAQMMIEMSVHHMPVADNDRLLGMISTFDFTNMVANGSWADAELAGAV